MKNFVTDTEKKTPAKMTMGCISCCQKMIFAHVYVKMSRRRKKKENKHGCMFN